MCKKNKPCSLQYWYDMNTLVDGKPYINKYGQIIQKGYVIRINTPFGKERKLIEWSCNEKHIEATKIYSRAGLSNKFVNKEIGRAHV